MRTRLLVLLVGGLALGLLAGCQSKFTRENFELIRPGVSDKEDVRKTLGKPSSTSLGDEWVYDNLDRHLTAIIYFGPDDRVLNKEWIDSGTGEWEGRNPNTNPPPEGEVREHHKRTRRINDD